MIQHKKNVTADNLEKVGRRARYLLLFLFIFMVFAIIASSYLYYRDYQKNYRVEVERKLSAISKLKVDELVNWHQERFWDASIFLKNNSFAELVRRFSENPKDADAQRELQGWLGKIQTSHQYDQVRLCNTQGVTLLSVPANRPPITSALLQRLPEILRSGRVTFQDFYRDDYDQRIYLSILVPIIDEKKNNQPLGVLFLRINLATWFYPFIQSWPTESRTAETLLVRRDGNNVLFLNELKFQKDTALKLRVSLDKNKELPAVKAVLGHDGIVEGPDYRGVPVVAYVCAVPDSPWFLVTRMDISEIYAPAKQHLVMLVSFVVILFLGVAAGLSLLWRQQSLRFYREQYKAADALRESEERFRSIFDNSNDGIIVADVTTGKFLFGNRAMLRILGYTLEELMALGVKDIHPQKDLPAVMEVFGKQARREIKVAPEIPVQRKDGSVFFADIDAFPLNLEDKTRIVGVFHDITERKQAEQKLRESKSLIESVVENVPLMIFLKEAKDLRFVLFNRAGEELLGYDRKTLLGKNDLDLFPSEQSAYFMAKDREVLDGEVGVVDIPEEPILTAEKGQRLLHTRKVCILGADGKAKFLLGISEDITERKQAEEEKHSLQEQLIRSEKLAAVGELIAGVVHEINNPLTGMKGLSELLMNETQDEEKKKDLRFIHQSAERIEKIVKNLQHFAHREKPSRKYVNINELIDVVISIRNYEMEARNIKIERHYQPDLPLVFTDPSQLEQVFLSLIINAEYAIHDKQQKAGTLTIATSVVPDNADGRTVVIEFSDTGPGIPGDVLPKIFNPFFTTKPVGQGTGLGLSVSYGIIKEHGGEISAGNRKEGGAVFTIKLPVQGGGKR